jgi:hypothetical protein
MKKKRNFLLILFYYLLLCQFIVLAQEPDTNSLESVTQARLYNLKARLKIKDTFERSYWSEKEKIDWKEEVVNWKFGLLTTEDNLPPFVIFQDNLFLKQNFYWVHDGAKILVINPLDKFAVTKLIFFANAFKKDTTLRIYVNGQFKEKIVVPTQNDGCSAEFTKKFVMDNISLMPGINEIVFCASKRSNIKTFSSKKTKNLFIRLKNDVRFEVKTLNPFSCSIPKPRYALAAEAEALNVLVYPDIKKNDGLFLMSRDLDIDLEEYPYLDFTYEFEKHNKRLDVFLGIDYNNDGKIDDYLNPEGFRGINVLELSRNKWPDNDWQYYPSFKLKRIFILCWSKDRDIREEVYKEFIIDDDSYTLRLKNFSFFSNKSIVMPILKYKISDLVIGQVNCKSYDTFLKEDTIMINTYFHSKKKDIEKGGNFTLEHSIIPKQRRVYLFKQEEEEEEEGEEFVELNLPIEILRQNKDRNSFLTFWYKLQRPDVQEINVLLGLDNDGNGSIDERIFIPKQGLADLSAENNFQKREINLSKFSPDIEKIRYIIFQLNKKDDIGKDDWHTFYIKDDIVIFRKYPGIIKTDELRRNLLSELNNLNMPILNIDQQEFKFSQINNKSWDIFEDDIVNLGNCKLQKGNHRINLLENDTFKTEWAFVEAVSEEDSMESPIQEPEIIFKKINQTKYIVQVKGARNPFWLVFLESFHPQWKIYLSKEASEGYDIIKEDKNLGAKEARYQLKFNPFDLKYIFSKPLTDKHFLVNLYANGWYIDTKKLNLPEEFNLVLYFWPQYLFNIGLIVAATTLICCIGYLIIAAFFKKGNAAGA